MGTADDVRRIIRERTDLFQANFAAKDADQLVADYYVEEPVMTGPDTGFLRGKPALTAVFAEVFKAFDALEIVQDWISVSNDLDMAYEVSRVIATLPGGDKTEMRQLIVWRKAPDTWRVECDLFATGTL